MPEEETLPMSDAEIAVVRRIAQRDGISMDAAALRLAQEELARRVKKRTGKNPARVYSMANRRKK